jgi:hypothetical protein
LQSNWIASMAKPQKSLAEAMQEMREQASPAPVQPSDDVQEIETVAEPRKPDSRRAKKHIGGYFDLTVWQQWSYLRIEQDGRSTQELLEEAINDLFRKYGKSAIG